MPTINWRTMKKTATQFNSISKFATTALAIAAAVRIARGGRNGPP